MILIHFDCGGRVTYRDDWATCDRCHAHAHRLDTRHPSENAGDVDRDTETAYLLRLPCPDCHGKGVQTFSDPAESGSGEHTVIEHCETCQGEGR